MSCLWSGSYIYIYIFQSYKISSRSDKSITVRENTTFCFTFPTLLWPWNYAEVTETAVNSLALTKLSLYLYLVLKEFLHQCWRKWQHCTVCHGRQYGLMAGSLDGLMFYASQEIINIRIDGARSLDCLANVHVKQSDNITCIPIYIFWCNKLTNQVKVSF